MSWIQSLNDAGNKETSTRKDVHKCAYEFYKSYTESPSETSRKRKKACGNRRQSTNARNNRSNKRDRSTATHQGIENEQSPGPDNLINETLKIGAPLLIPYLKLLFNEVVESEQVPDQWRLSQIILLYKKGNPLEVGNYRPISLLPSIYKLFSSILLSRIAPQIDKNQPIEQAGFRPNYEIITNWKY
ncbi:Probable RNA-directed DNA polymerase from transposon X-element [Eumeta japonica]|uniref:Probable RNA-directed DNA polymerase from transposon X-element n=1 Tax=Eumeta variegata TaxID=151549 RepID=A0A4C1ZS76_EUMVA|nr:Probable RNA-directed DNA polymerase from transposon X-element [Eumeta japonica]